MDGLIRLKSRTSEIIQNPFGDLQLNVQAGSIILLRSLLNCHVDASSCTHLRGMLSSIRSMALEQRVLQRNKPDGCTSVSIYHLTTVTLHKKDWTKRLNMC